MKQSLQLKLSQRLALTPQLKQSIRLLALSGAELQAEIRQALERNPLLEEGYPGGEAAIPDSESPAGDEPAARQEDAGAAQDEEFAPGAEEAFDLPYASGFGNEEEDEDRFAWSTAPVDLREHLLGQLGLVPLSAADRRIAEALIDSITPDGYLGASFEDIRAALMPEPPGDDEIEAVLHQIQNFDPTGVGARDVRECLLLQLRALPSSSTPGIETARRIVATELERLGRRDFPGLCRQLGVSRAELDTAVRLIQSLQPHPGARFATAAAQYIVPDVLVRKIKGRWVADLNPQAYPPLFINAAYRRLAGRGMDDRDGRFLRERLKEARWFLKSLRQRNETILRVARAVIERQTDFLEHGEAALRPLIMRDIASTLGMHESTVSRAVAGKYVLTPRGAFELKRFFSNALPGGAGTAVSSAAIRSAIRALVAAEPPDRPLGDGEIAARLKAQGMKVARRTVAKYREQMRLPPASQRRRTG